jgi:transcriptional regulator with XRE-family HTH domain
VDLAAIGKGVLERRLALNMSQDDLSKAAGLAGGSYISRIERGGWARPGGKVLEALSAALRVRDWRDLEAIGLGRLDPQSDFTGDISDRLAPPPVPADIHSLTQSVADLAASVTAMAKVMFEREGVEEKAGVSFPAWYRQLTTETPANEAQRSRLLKKAQQLDEEALIEQEVQRRVEEVLDQLVDESAWRLWREQRAQEKKRRQRGRARG